MKLSRFLPLAAMATLTIAASARAQELPDGQGKALVQNACSECHGVGVLLDQPRSREAWGEVVSRMVGNGAKLSDDDYNLVIEYLATHLGSASQSAPARSP